MYRNCDQWLAKQKAWRKWYYFGKCHPYPAESHPQPCSIFNSEFKARSELHFTMVCQHSCNFSGLYLFYNATTRFQTDNITSNMIRANSLSLHVCSCMLLHTVKTFSCCLKPQLKIPFPNRLSIPHKSDLNIEWQKASALSMTKWDVFLSSSWLLILFNES